MLACNGAVCPTWPLARTLRASWQVLLIQPDPHKYGMSTPVREAWQCLSERPLRKLSDLRGGKVRV